MDLTAVQDELAAVYAEVPAAVGAVVAVSRGGAAPAVTAFGTRSTDGSPMEASTIFQIASMTKPITTVVALQLIEEGRLRLDDGVSRWIPELAHRRVISGDGGERPADREITVEDLLTQRSGIPYAHDESGELGERMRERLGPPLGTTVTAQEWAERLGSLPQPIDPGARFRYGLSTDVLGVLIQREFGRGLGEVMAERVFEPLGMRDTGFWVRPGDVGRVARMYRSTPSGVVDVSIIARERPVFESAGGGLYSTADDYMRFLGMLGGGGELGGVRLLSPESVTTMTTNKLTPEQRALPALGVDDFFAAHGFGYGVAVLLEPEALPTGLRPGRGAYGWSGGFGTWWAIDPDRDVRILLLAQYETAVSGLVTSDPAMGALGHFRRRDVLALCRAVYHQVGSHA
ncbi:serine hydrolase [Microbacterium immunditiarum]|uniref:CubicO group peptidase (Beta-lactamase class C family) n=1 Tax=Microbacterium immunditiarum TaxID=337480 RepID=A0A7Y9GRV6_9MICO|nr:CubicO group peptidase (beta-lactamase class C family) [Microbacterium immunditiarum]